jgi:hypothetical protein
MARKVLLETTYTFDAANKTVTIPRAIPRERLILITNVTTNQVIYNFSDPNLRATSYTVSGAPNANLTTIVLNYNTASMSNSHKLQFTYDEPGETFTPSETYVDPVNKLRVSQPQALIDTDFEYGTQITKWENLSLVNNRPFVFASPTQVPNITGISLPAGSKTVTVTTNPAHGLTVGTPISVQDTFLSVANGNFIITSVTSTTFVYQAKANNSTSITAIFDSNRTAIYTGSSFTGAAIGSSPSYSYAAAGGGAAVTVTTSIPHGLAIGNVVAIVGSSSTTNPPNGDFAVARIISNTQFVVYASALPTGTVTGGNIYVIPQGQVIHRPFDGGVIFTSNGVGNYETVVRQTRRYFRYQSGKGLQISSGTILKPALQIDSISANGTTITVTTKEQHNILPGTTITVSGANEAAYNGTFTSVGVTGFNTFTYTALSTPSTAIASGSIYVSVEGWYGAVNRLGAFDFQNGIFFEFDGQQLYAVRRNSTFQLAGKISVNNGDTTVSQTSTSFPTYFSKQANIGDFIVIRGMQYRITDIASDISMTITPAYRGTSVSNATVSKTQDLKIPQSQWNIDKCDGTGPSGYNMDLTKMQMFYIDYSWYGAGFIRWGFRGADGNVFYVHKLANNNLNQEAYMRSGNLPARYETQTQPPYTKINASVGASDTTINVLSTSGFPTSGTIVLRNATTYEYMNYSGKTATSFTGVTRAQAGGTPTITTVLGSNAVTVSSATGLQVGQRCFSANIPEGAYITAIQGTTVTLTSAATAAGSGTASAFAAMGATSGQAFSFVDTDPVAVELAFPTFAPTISHWGTSVMMDGRFDDDKSLIFTFGQTTVTNIANGTSKALFSIRVAPSVDNGIGAAFGARELVNRLQLTLDSIGISIRGNGNLLVTAVLNGTPSSTTAWTNAVNNSTTAANSSLAQIANYAGGSTTVSGGETIAGFYVAGTDRLDLTELRDLGNSILGGGGANSNTQFYPDGPDTLTFVVTNLASSGNADVLGRISWKEAQA